MTSTYIAPPIVWFTAGVVLVYLAAIGYLMNYLEKAHRETWLELGSPSIIFNNSIKNGFLTLKFLFSSRYRKLNDTKLVKLIWGVRALLLLGSTLLITDNLLGY